MGDWSEAVFLWYQHKSVAKGKVVDLTIWICNQLCVDKLCMNCNLHVNNSTISDNIRRFAHMEGFDGVLYLTKVKQSGILRV